MPTQPKFSFACAVANGYHVATSVVRQFQMVYDLGNAEEALFLMKFLSLTQNPFEQRG